MRIFLLAVLGHHRGLLTVMNGISYDFSKSGLHVDADQSKIPALYTLQLFLSPPQVLVGQI